jgi:hypothetical protein
LLGTGNLLCVALFVEYLTNPKFGMAYGSRDVALITSTIPMAVFVCMIVPWGLLFDKLPFYRLRTTVNFFFVGGILIYYFGNGFWALSIGMSFNAIGKSGGHVLWSLWVTKFAKAELVGEYMSVHTFLTGIRGVISPLIAFTCISFAGPGSVQWIAIGGASLIVLASMILWPEIQQEKSKNLQNI